MRLQLVQRLLILVLAVAAVGLIGMHRVGDVRVAALSAGSSASGVFASDMSSIATALDRRSEALSDAGVQAISLEIIPIGRDLVLQSRIDAADGALIHETSPGIGGIDVTVVGMAAPNRAARWTYSAGWLTGLETFLLGILALITIGLLVLTRSGTGLKAPATNVPEAEPATAAADSTADLAAQIDALHQQLESTRQDFETRTLELEGERDKAAAADEAKSKFLATMSHELRTPLNAIIGFSEIMHLEQMGPIGNDRYKGYIGDVLESGRHLLSLVDDILDMSRLQVGKQQFEEVEIDVAEIIGSVVNLLGPESRNARVRLDMRMSPNIGRLWADLRAIRQVLTNILGNAVRYSKDTGHVTISARENAAGALVITVVDTGIGIAAEKLERVFDAFVQGSDDYSKAHEGTGLGLAIAKSLVEFHDGQITIESILDVGTTVTISFPPTRIIHTDLEADVTEFADETQLDATDAEWLALEHKGRFHAVHQGAGEFLVGRPNPRQPEMICDISVTDPRVSRPHARIIGSQGQFFLVDQSRRGTWLDRGAGQVEHVHQNVSAALEGAGRICLGAAPDDDDPTVISFVLRAEDVTAQRKVI